MKNLEKRLGAGLPNLVDDAAEEDDDDDDDKLDKNESLEAWLLLLLLRFDAKGLHLFYNSV